MLYKSLKAFISTRLSVLHDKEDENEIYEIVNKGIMFKGPNLWILIFAVFIASLGLNTNSIGVIIGAMLISPLMGPIMGFGMGIGLNDFDMVKRSFRNFAIATVFSVLTSTVYFLISPLNDAQSELLARTQPTIYDVLIAFFGGMAGMFAVSIKQKGNVIPGVAIATALMPPLCTAGFGLATANMYYFFGAFYLYLINSVFISFATILVVRFMGYQKRGLIDEQKNRQVKRYIGLIVLCTILPSCYLSYNMIIRNYRDNRITNFINDELNFPNTQLVSKEIIETKDSVSLNLIILGDRISPLLIANAQEKLERYNLKNVALHISQGIGEEDKQVDVTELRSMVLADLYSAQEGVLAQTRKEVDSLRNALNKYQEISSLGKRLMPEIEILFPHITQVSISMGNEVSRVDSVEQPFLWIVVHSNAAMDMIQQQQLSSWISTRTQIKHVRVLVEKNK